MKNAISRIAISSAFVVAVFCLSAASAQAQQNNEVPKVEVGPFFTLTRLQDLGSWPSGFGGRVTFNPHPNIGVDAETGYYPSIGLGELREEIGNASVKLKMLTGLFGLKFTGRQSCPI